MYMYDTYVHVCMQNKGIYQNEKNKLFFPFKVGGKHNTMCTFGRVVSYHCIFRFVVNCLKESIQDAVVQI